MYKSMIIAVSLVSVSGLGYSKESKSKKNQCIYADVVYEEGTSLEMAGRNRTCVKAQWTKNYCVYASKYFLEGDTLDQVGKKMQCTESKWIEAK